MGQSYPLIQAEDEIVFPCDTGKKEKNENTTYHAAILGNNGVSTSCVKRNHTMPIVLPATPP